MLRPDHDEDWHSIGQQWSLKPNIVYLNHGSFGPPPQCVVARREQSGRALDAQPMEWFVERFEPMWIASRDAVAKWLGAQPENMALVENATYAMNVVAFSFPLEPGDEVLLTDHEYGAVRRIWQRACETAGATLREVQLDGGSTLNDRTEVVERIAAATTERTRLVVVSHITSATALVLPVEEIVRAVHAKGAAVCIDGPHAIAQLPLNLEALGCDFYCASCHKWLSAAFGTGFLFAAPQWHDRIQAPLLSWGRLLPETPQTWVEELMWTGTRDTAAISTLPTAIDFLDDIGLLAFRERTHWLAKYAANALTSRLHLPSLAQPFDAWYGSMAHVQLPPGPALALQVSLRHKFRIETPVVEFSDRRWIRVSCHLYNTQQEIDYLTESLMEALAEE